MAQTNVTHRNLGGGISHSLPLDRTSKWLGAGGTAGSSRQSSKRLAPSGEWRSRQLWEEGLETAQGGSQPSGSLASQIFFGWLGGWKPEFSTHQKCDSLLAGGSKENPIMAPPLVHSHTLRHFSRKRVRQNWGTHRYSLQVFCPSLVVSSSRPAHVK